MNEPTRQRGLIRKSVFSQSYLKAQRGIRHHAILIGKLTFLWNSVHAELLSLFIELAKEKNADDDAASSASVRIWHDQGSDSAQRSLLLAFADLKMVRNPALLERVRWLVAELKCLSTYRNDAVHATFEVRVDGRRVTDFSMPATHAIHLNRLSRLESVGHRKLFRAVIHDLYLLGDFAWQILSRLEHPSPELDVRSPPEKPSLRSRKLVEKSPPKSKTFGELR